MQGLGAEGRAWLAEGWKVLVPSNSFVLSVLARKVWVALIIWAMSVPLSGRSESASHEGLRVRFIRDGGGSLVQEEDVEILPSMAMYIPAGEAPTPLMAPGPFAVDWRGSLSVPLRDDYRFRAFVKGSFELSLNDETVIEIVDGDGWVEGTQEIRLKKGANAVRALLKGNSDNDVAVRLEWSSPDFLFEPVSSRHWSAEATEQETRFSEIRLGRSLFLKYRCGACHVDEDGNYLNRTLMDGVDLSGVTRRRKGAWLEDWILHPKAMRSRATMPVVFRGEQGSKQVSAVLAFLQHESGGDRTRPDPSEPGLQEVGAQIYETLNCAGCHQNETRAALDDDRIWLGRIGEKFSRQDLVDFLKRPSAHYPGIGMPEFGLSDREAANLAAHLLGASESEGLDIESPVLGDVEEGQTLYAKRGCVNCHPGRLETHDSGMEPIRIKIGDLDHGCLAADMAKFPLSPDFGLNDGQRRALRLVLRDHRDSINRQVAREAATRHLESLRCAACHGELEGVPALGHFGEKLEPAWMSTLFSGLIDAKPRPWVAARMPAFPHYATTLSIGLSHRHGYAGQSEAPEEVDLDLAEVGRQLISLVNGFSCVSCHGVAELEPTQVFESEGINFSLSGARLRKDYYRRWVLNPVRIDPATKMPVYFDEEGNSPLFDVLNGETDRQLDAMWHYLLLGDEMVPPYLE